MNVLVARPIKAMHRGCYRVHKPDCSVLRRYSDVTPLPSLPDGVETFDCSLCGGRYPARVPTHCSKGHPFDAENTMHYRNKDGTVVRKCRICTREDETLRRPERSRRQWSDEDFRRRQSEAQKRYVKRFPEKNAAHMRVYTALRNGTLVRPDHCEWCEKACIPEASHDDYDKPLEVEWLCRKCHALKDRKYHAGTRPNARSLAHDGSAD